MFIYIYIHTRIYTIQAMYFSPILRGLLGRRLRSSSRAEASDPGLGPGAWQDTAGASGGRGVPQGFERASPKVYRSYIYMYIHVSLYLSMCVYIYIYTYIHIYIYRYIHIYICFCVYIYTYYLPILPEGAWAFKKRPNEPK